MEEEKLIGPRNPNETDTEVLDQFYNFITDETVERNTDLEMSQQNVLQSINQILKDSEPREYKSIFFEGGGKFDELALMVRGRIFERRGSIEVGNGYQWAAITEQTTVRFGRSKIKSIVINGDTMLDGEGRHIQRLWHFDLANKAYSAEEYTLLDRFLNEPDKAIRDELFFKLAQR